MARIFSDGAEHGDDSRLSSGSGATGGGGRTGTYYYRKTNNSQAVLAVWPSTQTEIYVRFALRINNNGSGTSVVRILSGGSTGIDFQTNNNLGGSATFNIADGGSVRATTTAMPFNTNEWHLIELYIKRASSPNGAITCKIDGTTKATYTGTVTAVASYDRIGWGQGFNNGTSVDIDDIAVNDTTTGSDNSWVGEGGFLAALVPNGAGNYTDLIPDSGTAYQRVDEVPSNGDTDYVYESTVDKKSTYTMTNTAALPAGASISRVWVEVVAKKTAAVDDKIATLLRSNVTDSQGSDQSLSTSYARYLSSEYLVDPDDSAAWTTTKVDALEAGAVVR